MQPYPGTLSEVYASPESNLSSSAKRMLNLFFAE